MSTKREINGMLYRDEEIYPDRDLLLYYRDKLLFENPDCESLNWIKEETYRLALEHTKKERDKKKMEEMKKDLERMKEEVRMKITPFGVSRSNPFPKWEIYKVGLNQADSLGKIASEVVRDLVEDKKNNLIKELPIDQNSELKPKPKKERKW